MCDIPKRASPCVYSIDLLKASISAAKRVKSPFGKSGIDGQETNVGVQCETRG